MVTGQETSCHRQEVVSFRPLKETTDVQQKATQLSQSTALLLVQVPLCATVSGSLEAGLAGHSCCVSRSGASTDTTVPRESSRHRDAIPRKSWQPTGKLH